MIKKCLKKFMIIEEIELKNFKSYGNNVQKVKLHPSIGELILLHGANGNGKSSLLEATDYCLFNKVKGTKKKYMTLSTLPNRLNNNLMTSVSFGIGTNKFKIERGMNPSRLELLINNQPYDRTGKANINDKIEEIIGIDLDTFKSFISMSINDFRNFMTLSPEEKRKLLDKLFNLGVLNDLSTILKDLKKHNEEELRNFNNQLMMLEKNIVTFQTTIDKIKASQNLNLLEQMTVIKEQMSSHKENFEQTQEKIKKIEEKKAEIKKLIQSKKTEIQEIDFKIREILKEVRLYDAGKCPTCGTDLTDESHTEHKNELSLKEQDLKKILIEQQNHLNELVAKEDKLIKIDRETNSSYVELRTLLGRLKLQLDDLKNKETNKVNSDEIQTLIDQIDKHSVEKASVNNVIDEKAVTVKIFKQLESLFSEEGIKKSIISTIVKPINMYIVQNLQALKIPFQVTLDDTFNAKIELLGNEIEPDSLSTGETKKVNIAIMLAYLKMIRMKRNINILFLDEVFSSIDIEGIADLVVLLKQFARDWNVNIFLVHHSQIDLNLFDRILYIEKNITSYIREEVMHDVSLENLIE